MSNSFIKNFANAGIFFPAANVCNFMQGGNSAATEVAIANLLYSALIIGASSTLKGLPPTSPIRKFCSDTSATIHDEKPARNLLTSALRLVGRELSNPLRITSYCALAISGLLLASATGGAGAALFPGLAGLFFGIGNFIQSGSKIEKFRNTSSTSPIVKAMLHPAVWYGLGYCMTGIGIGGGLSLLAHPLKNLTASLLTTVGVTETLGALGLMASGKVTNQAAPFVGVAAGTAFFAATGIVTGNLLGATTGVFACAGELSLAILMQKLHNASTIDSTPIKSASKIENFLTAPIRGAMKRGWISSMPQTVKFWEQMRATNGRKRRFLTKNNRKT